MVNLTGLGIMLTHAIRLELAYCIRSEYRHSKLKPVYAQRYRHEHMGTHTEKNIHVSSSQKFNLDTVTNLKGKKISFKMIQKNLKQHFCFGKCERVL